MLNLTGLYLSTLVFPGLSTNDVFGHHERLAYVNFHYRTENVCGLCGSFEWLTDGLLRQKGRDEEAFWNGDVVL